MWTKPESIKQLILEQISSVSLNPKENNQIKHNSELKSYLILYTNSRFPTYSKQIKKLQLIYYH